jgi:hypothetical protein
MTGMAYQRSVCVAPSTDLVITDPWLRYRSARLVAREEAGCSFQCTVRTSV